MATSPTTPQLSELVRRLDEAVNSPCGTVCCHSVKDVLEEIVRSGQEFLLPEHMTPCNEKYARHLVHLDPDKRYSVLAMVWAGEQGTMIHDHANMWCCECVYRGRIKVVSYSMDGNEDELVQFTKELEVHAGPGEAGALIPPFDHHTIHNDHPEPSVTIHVYGGEMTWCHVFEPVEGGYKKVRRELCLNP